MTAKKRKSTDKCDKNVNILWSSSSSSDNEDSFVDFPKVKANSFGFKRPRIEWINTTITASSAGSSNPTSSSASSTTNNSCVDVESPVLNSFNIKLSPALNYNSDDTNGLSPVIGNKIVRSLKRSFTNFSPPNEKSPEIVSGISSIESDHSGSSHINISQSSIVEDVHAEPIQSSLSQKSCEQPLQIDEVHCESESESFDTTEAHCGSENSTLYHNTKPRRKKYKKGGVAFLLNKTIQKHKANIGIWQHEKYLHNNKSDDDEFCTLSLERKWKEYGCDVFECLEKNEGTNTTKKLLLMNSSSTFGINLEVNETFRLYPPFNRKKVKYKSVLTDCYFNVSKITVIR